ncbi:hypothetical protein [Streptomyces sp. NPDC057702]|uniref:hypothetical protein n=1 Tax=unclassified Streptomyces TaxID=2593676 RepID=UPI003679237F
MGEDARRAPEGGSGRAARTRLRALCTPLTALGLLLVLIGAVTLWVGKGAHRLATGETARVRTIERCAEDDNAAPTSSCGSEWIFADGHTGHGRIHDPPVTLGDKIFAGDDWAYTSSGPLHRDVWLPGALLCALVLAAVALGIGYRVDTRRARATHHAPGPADPPPSARASPPVDA